MIDTIAMDLRRAVAVTITTSPSSTPARKFASGSQMTIQDGTYNSVTDAVGTGTGPSVSLTLTIPGFYQSDDPNSLSYGNVTGLVSTGNAVRYGTSSGVAADITVQYFKAYRSQFGSECYIRRETSAGVAVEKVVAEKAEYIDVDISAESDTVFVVSTWFVPTFSNAGTRSTARITSSDRVLLRNPRRGDLP